MGPFHSGRSGSSLGDLNKPTRQREVTLCSSHTDPTTPSTVLPQGLCISSPHHLQLSSCRSLPGSLLHLPGSPHLHGEAPNHPLQKRPGGAEKSECEDDLAFNSAITLPEQRKPLVPLDYPMDGSFGKF